MFLQYSDPREIEKLEKQLLQIIEIILARKKTLLIETAQYNKLKQMNRINSENNSIKNFVCFIIDIFYCLK